MEISLSTKLLIGGAYSALLITIGFGAAWHLKELDEKAALLDAVQHKDTVVTAQQQVTTVAAEAAVVHQVEIRTVTQTIIKKVPIYVTKKDNARCAIGPGFVLLHNAAAGGSLSGLPNAAGESDAGPSSLASPQQ
ncbi:hypothetical protein [Telmatospirillum sp.]|uniref:hypothetical protein n=1 Tax=Telmatospirillum sp. TaxID=2079197 RepID=UPI0028489106|nr:hypothetical protein [Telmatospirillum sp.]MDR3436458.1 hypothetical protein [Telmatospirillum sp.]